LSIIDDKEGNMIVLESRGRSRSQGAPVTSVGGLTAGRKKTEKERLEIAARRGQEIERAAMLGVMIQLNERQASRSFARASGANETGRRTSQFFEGEPLMDFCGAIEGRRNGRCNRGIGRLVQKAKDMGNRLLVENSEFNGLNQVARNRGRVSFAIGRGFEGIDPEPVMEIERVAIANYRGVGATVFVLSELAERARRSAKTHFL
jgi:hypothetical protein